MSSGSKPETTIGLRSFCGDPLVRTAADDGGNVARADESVQPHVGRIQNRADRGDDGDVIAEHREVADALRLGAHHRERGGRRRGLKTDGEKHDVLVGIEPGQLQRIGRRIHDANIHAAGLVFERAALGSGDAHHVAEGGENYIRLLRDGQGRRRFFPWEARRPGSRGRESTRCFPEEYLSGRSDRWHEYVRRRLPSCGSGVRVPARRRISSAVFEISSGSRNSSTNLMPIPLLAGWTQAGVNSHPPVRIPGLPASRRRSLPASAACSSGRRHPAR